MQKIEITPENVGVRLDMFLTEIEPELSRSSIKNLITKGIVLVGNEQKKAGYSLKLGDIVTYSIPEPVKVNVCPQCIPIDIVYEDKDLAVINKPQGLAVHPSAGHEDHTLVNALLFHFKDLSGINGELRPGIVHRLDKDTSGLMLVAKNDFAHRSLAEQIANKTCVRRYYALLEGRLKEGGHIETYIARDPHHRKKMAVSHDPNDRLAITDYKIIRLFEKYTFAEFQLKTGRTHQIRVHAQYLGHPVVGDVAYGYKKQEFKLNGQLLHSHYIEFTHPRTQERLNFEAPLPEYFQHVLDILEAREKGKI